MPVFLIGFMGSGKSAVGKLLSQRSGEQFVDMDEEIEKRENRSILEIFNESGEKYFREIESQLLAEFSHLKNTLIACGGGIIEREENRNILVKNLTFYLYAPFEEIWDRIKGDSTRPLAMRRKKFVKKLYDKREPLYRATGIPIDTTGMKIEDIVNLLMKKFRYDNQR